MCTNCTSITSYSLSLHHFAKQTSEQIRINILSLSQFITAAKMTSEIWLNLRPCTAARNSLKSKRLPSILHIFE